MRRLTAFLAALALSGCDSALTADDLLSAPCGPDQAFASAVGCARCRQLLAPASGFDVDVALRLDPAVRPFLVESVGYFIEGGTPGCDAGRAHTIRLHRTSGFPPNQPTEGLLFEERRPERPYRFLRPVVASVDPPILVEAEDSLFLTLDLATAGGTDGLCLRACAQGRPDIDYVSTLSEFGAWLDAVEDSDLDINVQAFVRGRQP